jgi:hypothetical protein
VQMPLAGSLLRYAQLYDTDVSVIINSDVILTSSFVRSMAQVSTAVWLDEIDGGGGGAARRTHSHTHHLTPSHTISHHLTPHCTATNHLTRILNDLPSSDTPSTPHLRCLLSFLTGS